MIDLVRYILLCCAVYGAVSCGGRNSPAQAHKEEQTLADTLPDSPAEARMRDAGLVDIARIDPSIRVHLVYATPDNFMGRVLYSDIRKAFLHPEAARKLIRAQQILHAERPGYSLLVYDAARPFGVQEQMWREAVRLGKTFFVANPARGGGLHNYGAAVDVTIVDPSGDPLPMGTPYDYFGPEANTDREDALLAAGKITRQEFENRRLLRRVMTDAGFVTVASEWWHFNHVRRDEAVRTLTRID